MTEEITKGLVLTPPPFEAGLGVWSRDDGMPGSSTYAGDANAAFVAADSDFDGCLEILKTETTQKLRYIGQTPLEPGCYVMVTARIKAISGDLPRVRIAGFASASCGSALPGALIKGPEVALTSYGEVVEVSAIVGPGGRPGVDLTLDKTTAYGHFGLDLTGANGGVVRINDFKIFDITRAFLSTRLD